MVFLPLDSLELTLHKHQRWHQSDCQQYAKRQDNYVIQISEHGDEIGNEVDWTQRIAHDKN